MRAVVICGVLLIVLFRSNQRPSTDQPVPIIKGSNYNEIPRQELPIRSVVTEGTRTADVRLPADEQGFIRAVQTGQVAFRASPNERLLPRK
jgi:hypothetical protein